MDPQEELRRLYTRLDELDRMYEFVATVEIEDDPTALEQWHKEQDETKARIHEIKEGTLPPCNE